MKTPMNEHFSEFEVRCLTNRWAAHTDPEKVEQLWQAAETKEAFIKSLQADDDLRYGQACGVLSRGDFYFIRDMIGERQIKTASDAGGVRVGNDAFQIIIPNGHGDGVSRVGIIPKGDEFNTDTLTYFTILSGGFAIYSSDCGPLFPAEEINGTYQVYHGNGFVIFREV